MSRIYNILKLTLTLAVLFICAQSCLDPGEVEPRDNPRDKEGDYYFPPEVKAMDDAGVAINQEVIIKATASDSGVRTKGKVEKYYWALDGKTYKDSTTKDYIENSWSDEGKYTVKVKVRDEDGLFSDEDDVVITVMENPPTVKAMADAGISARKEVTITAVGIDSGGKVEMYYWALDGKTYKDSTTKDHIEHTWRDEGDYTVKVKVRDNDDVFSLEDSVVFTCVLNAPTITAMDDITIDYNEELKLTASAKDKNGSIKKYVWTLDGEDFEKPKGEISHKFTNGGENKVLVKAIDDDGIESITEEIVVTVDLREPDISLKPSSKTTGVGHPVKLTASASDENGTVEGYRWAVDGKKFGKITEDSTYEVPCSKKGEVEVLVKAVDNDGFESVVDTSIITVIPNEPVLLSPKNDSVLEDMGVTLKWKAGFYVDSFQVLLDTVNPPKKIVKTIKGKYEYSVSLKKADMMYYFRIRAFGINGKSSISAIKRVKTPPPPPHLCVNGKFKDIRDRQTYKCVEIGGQTWMAENLNYTPESGSSRCYDYMSSHCDKYGRLYEWNTALANNHGNGKDVCPEGWHLPSEGEWVTLASFITSDKNLQGRDKYDNFYSVGHYLKSAIDWGGDEKETYGFNALPAGSYVHAVDYHYLGKYTTFFTSTTTEKGEIVTIFLAFDSDILTFEYSIWTTADFSIRCIQD